MLSVRGIEEAEVVIIEDGSSDPAHHVIEQFHDRLNISYYQKPNSGPGASRNYGMSRAKGEYFLILDSDVMLPPHYLASWTQYLERSFVDCAGGPDKAHSSFTDFQKAVDYSMTSLFTTGGVRGGREEDFQPRSFNMGLSRKAFEASGGFGRVHPGEDPDLVLRLKKLGFSTGLVREGCLFHKRRIDWKSFYKQVRKFGIVRVFLNKWHSGSGKITYWFPTFFCLFTFAAILMALAGSYIGLCLLGGYLVLISLHAALVAGIGVSLRVPVVVMIQFFGYGIGFFISWIKIKVLGRQPENSYPELFFKKS
jgi:GT2 family glycosyltransferase